MSDEHTNNGVTECASPVDVDLDIPVQGHCADSVYDDRPKNVDHTDDGVNSAKGVNVSAIDDYACSHPSLYPNGNNTYVVEKDPTSQQQKRA